jgi:hypothetical protein
MKSFKNISEVIAAADVLLAKVPLNEWRTLGFISGVRVTAMRKGQISPAQEQGVADAFKKYFGSTAKLDKHLASIRAEKVQNFLHNLDGIAIDGYVSVADVARTARRSESVGLKYMRSHLGARFVMKSGFSKNFPGRAHSAVTIDDGMALLDILNSNEVRRIKNRVERAHGEPAEVEIVEESLLPEAEVVSEVVEAPVEEATRVPQDLGIVTAPVQQGGFKRWMRNLFGAQAA